ncbi:hypothetical protein FJR77_07020 [Streptococcus shenyangsis]|uniref:Uncharacterized protein n=1 Tax=Streptococcus shenyangsis TaxID=2589786 RepID=A0ABY2YII9_9STRE|nr:MULTISPECIES: hypothetical protein [Streptococcus]TPE39317.1 hypothetical protein FJR73_06595 [Streptococcus sp. D2]TPE39425.1 hypothetical protein FJR77_07020 [Streptococcus shenyangsis]
MSKDKPKEELSKELKEPLEICLKTIVGKDSLNELHFDDGEQFLNKFSLWHQKKGQDLIKSFVDKIKNSNTTEDFSWLDILDEDLRWNKFIEENHKWKLADKTKYLNMRYQIPTHFHGDIDNAIIFHCLENPRGYLGDYKDSDIDKGFENTNLREYYKKSKTLLENKYKNEDKSNLIEYIKNTIREKSPTDHINLASVIQERYQLNDIKSVSSIIHSKKSNLMSEIEQLYSSGTVFKDQSGKRKKTLLKDYYYFKEYYSQLIQTDTKLDFEKLQNKETDVKNIASKLCNLEIYPFACAQPALGKNGIGKNILENSELSRLSAYIVLRRIYKYLNSEFEKEKPIFVFRKYDRAWNKLFKQIFSEVKEKNTTFKVDDVMKKLEENFFYCQLANTGGGITDGNVISVPNYELFLNMKKEAFKEISELLPRIDIKKVSSKKAVD